MRRIYTFFSWVLLLCLACGPASAQDKIWGFNPTGGSVGIGDIYRIDAASGSRQVAYTLAPDTTNPGSMPSGRLTEYNGLLYGMTPAGGSSNAGVIFSYDPVTGGYKVLYNFDNTHGGGPVGSLTVYNNILYGLTNSGGATNQGVLFSFDPVTGAYNDLHDFINATGYSPYGSLLVYNNYLYGTTQNGGGTGNTGVVFRLDPATNNYQMILLSNAAGTSPYGDLVAYNGLLYGLARIGGPNRAGTIFAVMPDLSSVTIRHAFTYRASASPVKQGGLPAGSLVLYNNTLYGLTKGGPNAGDVILFSFTPAAVPANDVFTMNVTTGLGSAVTYNSLIVYNNLLYGLLGTGDVFSYDPAGGGSTVTTLANVGGNPQGSLSVYNNLLYGMVYNGGIVGFGEIFSVDPTSGAYQRLVNMNQVNVKNGASLTSRPVIAGDMLYGSTGGGGIYNKGILFSYNRSSGVFIKLADFDGTNTGYGVSNNMVLSDSVLYGATQSGGKYGNGILFSFDLRAGGPIRKLANLGNPADPNSGYGLTGNIVPINGKLYFICAFGTSGQNGGIFSYDPVAGSLALLHSFGGSDGYQVGGGLALSDNALLYGQTAYGGSNGNGVIYSLDPATGTFTIVYNLTAAGTYSTVADLAYRNDSLYGLTRGSPGVLYGYSIANNSWTALHTFDMTVEGVPNGSLVLSGGKVYGLSYTPDEVWQYDLGTGTFAAGQPLETNPARYADYGIALASPLPQQIAFSNVTMTYGDADLDPGAVASSKLPVTYTTGDPSIATIVGGKVHVVKTGVTTITASQAGNDTYLGASPVTVNLTIRKALLQVYANDTSMVYGSVGVSRLGLHYAGFVNGQDSTALLSQATVTTDATAASHVRGANYTISVSGASAANYDFIYHTGVLTITPKPLVITADNKQKLTGGADPVFTATSSGFATPADSLALLPTVQFAVQPDGTIVPSGVVSTDYQTSYVNGSMTVGATAFQPVTGKTYGDADFVLSAAAISGAVPVYTGDNPAVATVGSDGTVHILHSGTVTLSADLGSAGRLSQVLTIAKKTLTVTADDQLIHFGDAIPALTFQYSGWVNGDGASSLLQAPVAVTTATSASPGGIYPITVSGGSAADYQLVYVAGRLTISTLPWQGSTLTLDPIGSKTYGNGDFAASVSSTNPNMPITLKSSNSQVAVIVNGNIHIVGAGQVTITASQEGDISHTAAPDVSQAFTVAPAMLTVTADSKTKVYGQPLPLLTVSYSGWVGSDGPSVLVSKPVAAVSGVNSATAPGVYPISVSGGSAANYSLQYVAGTMTITSAQPVITFAALPARTYGDPDFSAGAASSNATAPVTYSSGNPSVAVVSASGVIHITGAGATTITASQAGNSNYAAAADVAQVLTVRQAVLTITPDDKVKVQGQSNPVFTFNYAGLAPGDDSSVVTVLPVATSTADAGSLPGLYSITASGAVANNNYLVSYRTGSLRVIVDSTLHNDRLDAWCTSPTSLEVEVFAMANQQATIQVYALTGQPVVSKEVWLVNGDNHLTLPVAGIAPGMYVVRVMGQYLKLSQKIRIQ